MGTAMDMESIYVKTAKGQDEVATRAYQLPSRVRSLLVMVDGKATGDQIVENTAVLGNSAAFFQMLVEEGFIEPVTTPGRTGTARTSSQDVKKPPKALVQTVSHLVTEILGPVGDSLTLRLEKSPSLEDFAMLLEQARGVIESNSGKKKADQFWNDVRDNLSRTGDLGT